MQPSPIKSESINLSSLFGSKKAANKPSNLNLNRVSEKPLFTSSSLFTNKIPVNPSKASPFSQSSSSQIENHSETNRYKKMLTNTSPQQEQNEIGSGLFNKTFPSQTSIFDKNYAKNSEDSPDKQDELMTQKHFKPKQTDTAARRQSETPTVKPLDIFNDEKNIKNIQARSNTVKFMSSGYTSVICYSCGQRGHYSPECPTRPKGDLSKYHCFHCGERGHFAQRCPEKYF